MATLTHADFQAYQQSLRSDPVARAEMRAAALSKTQWQAALQAAEAAWEANRAALKATMEGAAGRPLSATLARKLVRAWMQRKVEGE